MARLRRRRWWQLAAQRKVEVLALTDHDTTLGLDEARAACAAAGIGFVTGVEITAGWRGQEIHVVGLGVDPDSPQLQSHLTQLVQLRRDRIVAIGERLQQGTRDSRTAISPRRCSPPRQCPRACTWHGPWWRWALADTTQDAFDRYLGRGCVGPRAAAVADGGGGHRGHPRCRWPRGAGARRIATSCPAARCATCARSSLAGAAARWRSACPGCRPDDASRLASLARQHSLAGSAASDFHEPGLPWRPLGRFAKLAGWNRAAAAAPEGGLKSEPLHV